LSVQGLSSGTAEIETVDQSATLPIIVYDSYNYGGWYGIIISASNTKQLTQERAKAHLWSEPRADYGGNFWKSLVPTYCADPSTDPFGFNHDRIAAIRTVDVERLAIAPTDQWLEINQIYVCRVPDGYVKVSSTTRGLVWFFSPEPQFP
jgi:hypothetical protein